MNIEALEKLGKVAFHYKLSTGVNCLFVQNSHERICQICQHDKGCEECHKKAIVHAETFGGSYVYLCPRDLMFWTSPIFYEGNSIGAFIAGPVVSMDPEELDMPELNDGQFKTVSPDEAYSLSRMLFMCSSFVFSEVNQKIRQNEIMLNISSGINESIQEIKENKQSTSLKEIFISLYSGMKTGNEKLSEKITNECISACLSTYDQSMDTIKSWASVIVNTMLYGTIAGQANEVQVCNKAISVIKLINDSKNSDQIFSLIDSCRKFFCKTVVKSIMGQGINPVIIKSLNFMQNNLAHPISELDVARNVNLSISHFSRLFNSEVGMSFSKYMNKLRTERAKELLMTSNMSLLEICNATGFEEQSYFTRIFKTYQGMSPNAFRMRTVRYPNQDLEIHN